MPHTSSQARIVVLDDWENALGRLVPWASFQDKAHIQIRNQPLQGPELIQAIRDATILVLTRDRCPINESILRQCPALEHIIFTGTRNRTLDIPAAQARGITVSHTDWGPSKASTCELTWALILASRKHILRYRLSKERNTWRDPDQKEPLPDVLSGSTLGLIGLGQIGQRVAAVGQALGMQVLAWSPNMTPERARDHSATAVGLEQLLRQSDVVSLHLVPSESTVGLLNASRLAQMKPGSLLVNTSRAELIVEQDLIEALEQRRPAAAALDVFHREPLADDHPLLNSPNVLLTPHLGFVNEAVFQHFAQGLQESLNAILNRQAVPRML